MTGIMKQEYDTFTRETLLRHREEEAKRMKRAEKKKEKTKSK